MLTPDEQLKIRVYCYQNRLPDAARIYQGATGCATDEAIDFIQECVAELMQSPGYKRKAFFFRLQKAISLAVPMGAIWALAGVVWASALGKSLVQFGIWSFGVAAVIAALLSPAIVAREQAGGMGMVFGGLGILMTAVGVIVGVVRRLLF